MTEFPQQLQREHVVPDVISDVHLVKNNLIVKWPTVELNEPGQTMDREATQREPILFLSPPPSEMQHNYVLMMTDPDLMARNDNSFGQVRHWLATGISVQEDGRLQIPKENNVSPYIGPAPLPNYITPRPHRYVFILSRSSECRMQVEHEDLVTLQTNYSAAFEGKQDLQDLKDRWGFNAQQLMDNKNLTVEAATFMLVGGTLKSAAANASMTAQAGINKLQGQ